MAFAYPPDNMTGIMSFIDYVNSFTDGFLGLGFLIIIFFVSFLSTKTYTYERAFAFASFLTMISALLLRFIGLINNTILSVAVIGLVISIIFLWKERSIEGA
ncbi:MAG: hypothetical protein ACTSPV_01190 [Candidatus Hodarchaeales archaeon]